MIPYSSNAHPIELRHPLYHKAWIKASWAVVLMILVACTPRAQSPLVDGRLDEWTSSPNIDGLDVSDPGQDILTYDLRDDNERIHFRMTLASSINLQDESSLQLYVDLDNDPSTGQPHQGLGVDLYYHFGERFGYTVEGGVRRFIGHSAVGLVTAPTVSSDVFELSFVKDLLPIQASQLCYLVETDQDRAPDQGQTCISLSGSARAPIDWAVDKAPNTVRILSYNVLRDRLFESSATAAYSRIFQALQPDVICFQEIYDHSADQIRSRMEELLDIEAFRYVERIDPDIVVYSKYPIDDFGRITGTGNGIFELDIGGRSWFIVNAHLPCCERNEDRQDEIDALHAYLRQARLGLEDIQIPDGSPILICGDMNTVGDAQHIISLRDGDIINEARYGADYDPDWDGTVLTDVMPITTGAPYVATWFSPGSSYVPGRLDLGLYTDAVLELDQAYGLHTAFLSSSTLSSLGLREDDTEVASDHIPLVMDYFIDPPSSTASVDDHPANLHLYPTPASDVLYVTASDELRTIQVYNLSGQQMMQLAATGQQKMIDIRHLPTGTYLLHVITDRGVVSQLWLKE